MKNSCYPNNSLSFDIENVRYEFDMNEIKRLHEEGITAVLVGTGKEKYSSKEGYLAEEELAIRFGRSGEEENR